VQRRRGSPVNPIENTHSFGSENQTHGLGYGGAGLLTAAPRRAIFLACLAIAACVALAILWPPRCSTSPDAWVANSILLIGCQRR
jgi:hypothetical protein